MFSFLNILFEYKSIMLHQSMLSNASFDVEISENRLLFVPFSQTGFVQLSLKKFL